MRIGTLWMTLILCWCCLVFAATTSSLSSTSDPDELYKAAMELLESSDPQSSTVSQSDNSHVLMTVTPVDITEIIPHISDLWSRFKQTIAYYLQDSDNLDPAVIWADKTKWSTPSTSASLDPNTVQALDWLKLAAEKDHRNSLNTLAEISLYGNFSTPRHYEASFKYYHQLAQKHGDSNAQFMLGFMYATGLFGHVVQSQSKANLYYTFAAYGGDVRAQMAMGYRMSQGIATARDLPKSLAFYKLAADQSMRKHYEGSPFDMGHFISQVSYSIVDMGIYGTKPRGAYQTSRTHGSRRTLVSKNTQSTMQYLEYLASEQEMPWAYSILAATYYDGAGDLEPNHESSLYYARRGAALVWKPNGELVAKDLNKETRVYGAACASIVGQFYLRGEAGLKQNIHMAVEWFNRAADFDDKMALDYIGYILLHGIGGVPVDYKKAQSYLTTAINSNYGPAHYHFAQLLLASGTNEDHALAITHLEMAGSRGVVDAWYLLANIYYDDSLPQIDNFISAEQAVYFYKVVSLTTNNYNHIAAWSYHKYHEGQKETALIGFMMDAEQGYATGQYNAAYLLDIDNRSMWDRFFKRAVGKVLSLPILSNISSGSNNGDGAYIKADTLRQLALTYYTRSAHQDLYDAYVRMGDLYLDAHNETLAAACYTMASDRGIGMARWNLAYMYEQGIGFAKDYHLAKRFYDTVLLVDPDAYLPVYLALKRLFFLAKFRKFHSFLKSFTGQSVPATSKLTTTTAPTAASIANTRGYSDIFAQLDGYDPANEDYIEQALSAPSLSFYESVLAFYHKWKNMSYDASLDVEKEGVTAAERNDFTIEMVSGGKKRNDDDDEDNDEYDEEMGIGDYIFLAFLVGLVAWVVLKRYLEGPPDQVPGQE